MATVRPPRKKVNAEESQIDFISGADRDPQEWDQYNHTDRKSNAIRLTERENKMLEAAAKKLSKEMGVHISKHALILLSIRDRLKKDLNTDPNEID